MEEQRTEYVANLFNDIAPKYDLINRIMTFRLDIRWRKKTIRQLLPYAPKRILDIGTGTGDLAIQASTLKPTSIIGIDPAPEMLSYAKKKIDARGLQNVISLQEGNAEKLTFGDNEFDAITIGFGVRNFSNLGKGLSEIHRVLIPGGTVVILETTRPLSFPMKQLHQFYFRRIILKLGKNIAKSKDAYAYFAQTVLTFPQRESFLKELQNSGFSSCRFKKLLLGTACIYIAHK